ncbi:hypothetical protein I1A62_00095 (plasmid) [Rhodococcus sp. USK10]|uniref:hypothetical protein n=1 Tax=Rhodococcus sp. USK10 TaxID=2789739 RepID=UPI001C5D98DB|nr:hypothetical protein [Rhodococcus sp. USK10]QYA99668.1 hypothetical protein I1A62_00095 [Rhodococcus sp. USK10]
MMVHCIETGRELTSDDAGHRRGSSPCPSLEGDTISRWSRHLATVITDTASTAGDVLVEEGFYEAALAVLTDILEATTSLRRRRRSHDQLLPGWYCRDWHDPDPSPGHGSRVGHPAHSLTGILDAAVTELLDIRTVGSLPQT